MSKPCEKCKLRAAYDRKPKSLVGKFWRWHIRFCPGWRAYHRSLSDDERLAIDQKYHIKKS